MMRAVGLGIAGALAACGTDSASPLDAAPVVIGDGRVVDGAAPPDAPAAVNGCTLATAVDRRAADADRTIVAEDDFFTPPCLRIARGQQVTWRSDFEEHPLAPGILRGPDVIEQPGSPITATGTGTTVTIEFASAGDWAFYCPAHPPEMAGAIFVDP